MRSLDAVADLLEELRCTTDAAAARRLVFDIIAALGEHLGIRFAS